MSGDVEALAEVLRQHLPRDRSDTDTGDNIGTYCTCGGWEGDYFADGEAGPFDDHLAQHLAAHVAAARAEERERVEALLPRFEADYGINSSPVTRLRALLPAAESREGDGR